MRKIRIRFRLDLSDSFLNKQRNDVIKHAKDQIKIASEIAQFFFVFIISITLAQKRKGEMKTSPFLFPSLNLTHILCLKLYFSPRLSRFFFCIRENVHRQKWERKKYVSLPLPLTSVRGARIHLYWKLLKKKKGEREIERKKRKKKSWAHFSLQGGKKFSSLTSSMKY